MDLAEDGTIVAKTVYERGVLVSPTAAVDAKPIVAPTDTSCAAASRHFVELAETQIGGGGIPEKNLAGATATMGRVGRDLARRCESEWDELQRTCVVLAESVVNLRWCEGPGPRWCAQAFDHALSLFEKHATASELSVLREASDSEILGCLQEAQLTQSSYDCVMRTQSAEALDKCTP